MSYHSRLVRRQDPNESRVAAAKITPKRRTDALVQLRGFVKVDRPTTHQVAAKEAAVIEGTEENHRRIESIRRRGSDLKEWGWIEQVGTSPDGGLFIVTDLGREVLSS